MKILITGGGGFLGRALSHRLAGEGHRVSVLGRGTYPQLAPEIESIRADIRDREAVERAIEGKDAVFHAASKVGIWGRSEEYQDINVGGTRNVIDACFKNGVPHLVFTSSPSVVFDRGDMEGVDETTPYPQTYLCDYPRTKAMAEQNVIKANGQNGLTTVSLRPHLIYGPGDTHLVPRILNRARKRRLVQVGRGENRVDIVYIDNAVQAHCLALQALIERPERVGGRCYFISDGTPVFLWQWVGNLLARLGLPPVARSISYPAAWRIGSALEFIYRSLGIGSEPAMTRFLAGQLATSHYFNIRRAREELKYEPLVGAEDAFERLTASLREVRPSG
ncbi:MAG: hypothetical protein COV67_15600 [Nitrospinae bacterium CG11_big_fil_rev_8_21_14_0_20_56_8]|nr:MAG: hypothetical protein COV67_15600 [Nitrospinae bacterium CG11_big_fil_rev_8_21_14_0_20_56_8]